MFELLHLFNEGHNLEIQNLMESQMVLLSQLCSSIPHHLFCKNSGPRPTRRLSTIDSYCQAAGSNDLRQQRRQFIDRGWCWIGAANIHFSSRSRSRTLSKQPSRSSEFAVYFKLMPLSVLIFDWQARSSVPRIVQMLLDFTQHIEHTNDAKASHSWRGIIFSDNSFNILLFLMYCPSNAGKYGLKKQLLKQLRVNGLSLLISLLEGRRPEKGDPVYSSMAAFEYRYSDNFISGGVRYWNRLQSFLSAQFRRS